MQEHNMKALCIKAYADWMESVTLTKEEVAMMGPAPIETAMRVIIKEQYGATDEDVAQYSDAIDKMALQYYEALLEAMQCLE